MLVIPATQEAEVEGFWLEVSLNNISCETLPEKQITSKRTRGIAQVW
jgi:hypothetical protein